MLDKLQLSIEVSEWSDCDTFVSCYSVLTARKTIGVFKCYYALYGYHYFIMYAAC